MKTAFVVVMGGTLFLFLGIILLGFWRTYKTEHSPNQKKFSEGRADTSILDGEFAGKVTGYNGSWKGKIFTRATNSGINRFISDNNSSTRYPFQTLVTTAIRDSHQVIRLDYNLPNNPWWLRHIVDEIVLVEPNTYLGKVHIRVAPGIIFTVGYFTLTK